MDASGKKNCQFFFAQPLFVNQNRYGRIYDIPAIDGKIQPGTVLSVFTVN